MCVGVGVCVMWVWVYICIYVHTYTISYVCVLCFVRRTHHYCVSNDIISIYDYPICYISYTLYFECGLLH